jgi:hypothetical protein
MDERQEAMGGGSRGFLAPARALWAGVSHQEVDGRRRGGAAARGLAGPAANDLPLAGVGVRRHAVSGARCRRCRHPRASVSPLRGGAQRGGARALPLGRPLRGRPPARRGHRGAALAPGIRAGRHLPVGAQPAGAGVPPAGGALTSPAPGAAAGPGRRRPPAAYTSRACG